MAKRNRFPDAYSSGSSGLHDMDISNYENSSSSAFRDGFSVPVHVIPLSNLPSNEKNKWLLKLKMELDQVRTFQKRAHVTNARKSLGLEKKTELDCNRTSFSQVLKKQCGNLLNKLISHRHGWMFNKAVDVVEFGVPDYYDVIKNPMDLGTIKEKLCSSEYSNPLEFLADVRLTFLNAKMYNPPGNDVHLMADILGKLFERRWKPIEKKLPESGSQKQKVNEEIDCPPLKKTKITTMTNEEKCNLSRDLEIHLDDLPDNIIDLLGEYCSNGNEGGEDEIEVDIDDLDNDALFKLRKMLDDYMQEKQNHAKAESCVVELLNEPGLSNSTVQLCKDNDSSNDSEIELNNVKASIPLNVSKEEAHISYLSENQSISGLDQIEQISQQKDDGDSALNERKILCHNLYRVALLKNRFADTILKAREKTLNQGENSDPENQKTKEKARMQAETEAKRKRDLDREASRQALLKMEKTVEINDTCRFFEDLEILRTTSCVDESSRDYESEAVNPLEQLGLYIKRDEHEDDTR